MDENPLHVTAMAIAAFNARDVETFVGYTTDDFEWLPSMSPIEGGRFRGAAGIGKYFELLGDAWERFEVRPAVYLHTAAGILMLGKLLGRGRGSGATVEDSLGMAFDLRDGRISRIRGFLDHDEARAAVGLTDP